jgi:hypothetical protein
MHYTISLARHHGYIPVQYEYSAIVLMMNLEITLYAAVKKCVTHSAEGTLDCPQAVFQPSDRVWEPGFRGFWKIPNIHPSVSNAIPHAIGCNGVYTATIPGHRPGQFFPERSSFSKKSYLLSTCMPAFSYKRVAPVGFWVSTSRRTLLLPF